MTSPTTYKITLAGLLHVVGKFAQRVYNTISKDLRHEKNCF